MEDEGALALEAHVPPEVHVHLLVLVAPRTAGAADAGCRAAPDGDGRAPAPAGRGQGASEGSGAFGRRAPRKAGAWKAGRAACSVGGAICGILDDHLRHGAPARPVGKGKMMRNGAPGRTRARPAAGAAPAMLPPRPAAGMAGWPAGCPQAFSPVVLAVAIVCWSAARADVRGARPGRRCTWPSAYVPALYIVHQARRQRVTDLDLFRRAERLRPMQVTLAAGIVAWLAMPSPAPRSACSWQRGRSRSWAR